MPTYGYRCKACTNEFDEWQSMSAERLLNCPKCNQPHLTRLMGAGGALVFKGSGFYLTDYRKGSPSPAKDGNGEGKQSATPSDPAKNSNSSEKPPSTTTASS